MKQSNFSEYENYLLMADKSKMKMTYSSFLDFQKVVSFVKQIANKSGDTFLHDGNIYKKKITSTEASRFLENLLKNSCNVSILRSVATQLEIRI